MSFDEFCASGVSGVRTAKLPSSYGEGAAAMRQGTAGSEGPASPQIFLGHFDKSLRILGSGGVEGGQ